MKLVLGCSYTDSAQANWHQTLFDEPYRVFGKGGVDNAWISRTGLHLLQDKEYDSVFVMFTGLDRTSINIPIDKSDNHYYFSFPIGFDHGPCGEVNLIQSGGPIGTWNSQLKGFGNEYFKKIYTSNCKKYLSELNMYYVIMFLSYLKAKNLPYKYTFIYDITKNYGEQSLGKCTAYYDLLDKTHYIPITPYEFAIKHDGFKEDNFHLTEQCQKNWAIAVKKYLYSD